RMPDESVSAASAVFATYVGRQAPLTAQAVQRLLPNRRALQTALSQFSSAVRYDHGRLLPTARAVLAVLATDPLAASLRVDLAVNALPGDELAQLIMDMATAHELHADALATAEQTLANGAQQLSEEEWAQLEATLAASADRYVRRLAVTALVMQSHDAHGWTDERQARLRAYRADPATLVASAAQFTFTPMEIGADT
ncbi:MAG: hypothetical protein M1546_17810, partial [Chloroflexi bacterium]|nr:hypothetical protein [Chloroflexota bacterium]